MGSGYFVLKGNDIVSIKGTTSTSPVKVSVSSIIAYGQTNNYGNAFALYDAGNSRSGVAIRFFNISGDTAYLGTVSYINNSSYIGISDGANNNNITTRSSTLFGSTPDGNISGLPVATNFTNTSRGGITYLCNGGSVSNYSSSQAFYLPNTITNIYVDTVKYNTPTWKQIFVDNSIFFGVQGTIVDFGICEKGFNWRLPDQQEIENINQYLTGEMTDSSSLPTSETEVYRKGTYSITASRSSNSGPGYGYNYNFKIDNEITNLYFSSGGNGNKRQKYKWALAIDEANQKAAFIAGGITVDNYFSYVGYANSNSDSSHTSTNLYNWLIGSGLLGATIKVNYYLPDYEYTYAKITYKQGSEPDSETDGESVEILKDETSVNIEGLEEEKTYYFKIFTDKSESEAFPYTVEVDPVPPEYKPYINEINRKAFGKTNDESFILDRSIGGTVIGVNHGYGDSFVNLSGFRIESSSNTFDVYVIPYVRIDIDFDETNNRYVATGTNLIGAVGLTKPEKNYFTCTANLQKPFEIRSSFKVSYNINNSLSPIVTTSDSVIGCLQRLQRLCCYVDIYVDGTAIDIVSR